MKNRIRQIVKEEIGKMRGNKRRLNEGRGNWVARYDGAWWPTYYISWPYEDELEDGYTADLMYDDVLGNMKYMSSMKKFKVEPTGPKTFDRDSTVRFENYTLKIIFADNEWSLAVGIVPNEHFYDDALEHGEEREFLKTFNIQASAILNELNGLYSLREPAGAWMSSPVKGKITVNM